MTNDLDRAAREYDDRQVHLEGVSGGILESAFKAGAAFERSRGVEVFVVEAQPQGEWVFYSWQTDESIARSIVGGLNMYHPNEAPYARYRKARILMEPTE